MQSEKKLRVYTASEAKGLTSSHQEYYIFSVPPCRIIFSENSEKYLLSMKQSLDNQINVFLIDISRIKLLDF